jgi:transposase
MAAKPKPMSQIKQILRLHSHGTSIKAISRSLSVSKNTVRKYISLQQASNRSIEDLLQVEDNRLEHLLFPGDGSDTAKRHRYLAEHYEYFRKELQRRGVTRWLLWSEYRQSQPDGYSYSQFCWHLQHLDAAARVTMGNLPHPPGEQLYVDFAGESGRYTDPQTGQTCQVPVFVATLGFSQYSYMEALHSQKAEDLLDGLQRALQFFGGVTKLIIPDNMKAAVIKSDRYEPSLNRLLEDIANHYGTVIVPARPAHPKDKSLVESGIRDLYRHVYAPLRNRQFFSRNELNRAYWQQLELWHDRTFQGRSETRRQRFETLEKPALQPLPAHAFEIKKYLSLTVRNNTHIQIKEDLHYYSVPYRYIKQKVKVIYTPRLVQIYHQGELVAQHQRVRTPFGYTTVQQHLPSHHQVWIQRDATWYLRRASRISPQVVRLMEQILASRAHPEQAYRSCDGVLSLHRKAGGTLLSQAAQIALDMNCCTYSFLKNLIQHGMASHYQPQPIGPLPEHSNIRGKDYFQQSFNFNPKPEHS